MGLLFGGGSDVSISTSDNKLSGMNIQNSSQGVPVALVYGKTRVPSNLLWYGDFIAVPHTTTTTSGGGGKGGGGGSTTQTHTSYTYTAGVVLGICEGPVVGYDKAWASKDITDNATLGLTEFLGSYAQNPWSYLTTNHPADAYTYRGTAYVATSALDLGDNSGMPNLSFEVEALLFASAITPPDLNVATVVDDILPNTNYGAGFPSSQIGDLTDFETYCTATGINISPAYITQRSAAEILTELAMIGNAGIVWSEGVLKIINYGDEI